MCEGHARLGALVSAQIPGSQGPLAPQGPQAHPSQNVSAHFLSSPRK